MARGYKTKGAPGQMDQYTQAAGRAAEEARRDWVDSTSKSLYELI